jgi:uncharacterized iron-regulated membrane protein
MSEMSILEIVGIVAGLGLLIALWAQPGGWFVGLSVLALIVTGVIVSGHRVEQYRQQAIVAEFSQRQAAPASAGASQLPDHPRGRS